MTYPLIDPIALSIGPLAIRWYALAYVAGIMLGWWWIVRLHARSSLWHNNTASFTRAQVEDVMLWATIGIVLGGRLGYVLFYNLPYYIENPEQILYTWNGGMAFHGGFIGLVLGIYLYCRRQRIPFFGLMDAIAAAAPIGLFFGRIANFINSELWGRVTESPLGMVFPNAGFAPRHPSQLYQAGLEGVCIFAILTIAIFKYNALKTHSRVSALFLISYGCARIIGEQFREPDAQLGYLYHGLTMGMVLSVPMVVLGLYLYQNKKN